MPGISSRLGGRGCLVLLGGDVAQSDRSDQAFVAHGHHGGDLLAEGDPGFGVATQADHGDLVELGRSADPLGVVGDLVRVQREQREPLLVAAEGQPSL